MNRITIVLLTAMCSAVVFSGPVSSISEIVGFMSTNDYQQCFALTNDIDSLMASTTGVLERSTCKLLKASILLDHSENMASDDSFVCATNLCREIELELSDMMAWQRIGALCKFTNAMIEDGHPEIAFAASTNLIYAFQYNQNVEADTNVWNALFKPGGLDIMPVVGFINANAAASRFRMDPCADLSLYTNGLPRDVIREIIRE